MRDLKDSQTGKITFTKETQGEEAETVAELDFMVSNEQGTPRTTTAQGARQRLRFCDGVPEEIMISLSRTERARQEAIFELIQTEQNYVQDLQVFIDDFVTPLSELSILTRDEIKSICINIEDILPLNKNFLEALQKRQNEAILVEDISDILLAYFPKLDAHIEYCWQHSFALKRVPIIAERNESFRDFLVAPKAKMKETLQGYLVKPFQRLTRYPMMTESILKKTTGNESRKTNLAIAMALAKKKTNRANSLLELEEERLKAVAVWEEVFQKNVCDHLLQAPKLRLFRKSLDNQLLQVDMNHMSHVSFYGKANMKHNNACLEGFVFLFNGCLFITKGKEESSFTPVQRIPIQDIHVVRKNNTLLLTNVENTNRRLSLLHGKQRHRSIAHSDKKSWLHKHETHINTIITLQSFLRMKVAQRQLQQHKKNISLIKKDINALLRIIREFNRRLQLAEDMMGPLQNNDDLREIFTPLAGISTLLKDTTKMENILSIIEPSEFATMANVFSVLENYFIPLGDYIDAHASCLKDLQSISKSRPELAALVANAEKAKGVVAGSLFDIFAYPLSQVTRYCSIYTSMIEFIPATYIHFEPAKRMLATLTQLQDHCERVRESNLNAVKLEGVREQLGMYEGVIEDHMILIRCGNLSLLPREISLTVFLFTDIIVLLDPKENHIRNIIPLKDIVLVDLDSIHFQLTQQTTQRSLIFRAPKNLHKRRWLNDIGDVLHQQYGSNFGKKSSGINLRKDFHPKASTNSHVTIFTGVDIWTFQFDGKGSLEREFLEKVEQSVSRAYADSLDRMTKKESSPFRTHVENGTKRLDAAHVPYLRPMIEKLAQIAHNELRWNQITQKKVIYAKSRQEKKKVRLQYLVTQMMQRPNSVLHIAPKPVFQAIPKNTNVSRTVTRERAATISRMGSLIPRTQSVSELEDENYVLCKKEIGDLAEGVKKQHVATQENRKQIELLDTQAMICSSILAKHTEHLTKIEDENKTLRSVMTEYQWKLEEKEKKLKLLQESVEKLMKERERERKKRRKARKAAKSGERAVEEPSTSCFSTGNAEASELNDIPKFVPVQLEDLKPAYYEPIHVKPEPVALDSFVDKQKAPSLMRKDRSVLTTSFMNLKLPKFTKRTKEKEVTRESKMASPLPDVSVPYDEKGRKKKKSQLHNRSESGSGSSHLPDTHSYEENVDSPQTPEVSKSRMKRVKSEIGASSLDTNRGRNGRTFLGDSSIKKEPRKKSRRIDDSESSSRLVSDQ